MPDGILDEVGPAKPGKAGEGPGRWLYSRSGLFDTHRFARRAVVLSHDMGLDAVGEKEDVEGFEATGRDCLGHGRHRAAARVGAPGRRCVEFRSLCICRGSGMTSACRACSGSLGGDA